MFSNIYKLLLLYIKQKHILSKEINNVLKQRPFEMIMLNEHERQQGYLLIKEYYITTLESEKCINRNLKQDIMNLLNEKNNNKFFSKSDKANNNITLDITTQNTKKQIDNKTYFTTSFNVNENSSNMFRSINSNINQNDLKGIELSNVDKNYNIALKSNNASTKPEIQEKEITSVSNNQTQSTENVNTSSEKLSINFENKSFEHIIPSTSSLNKEEIIKKQTSNYLSISPDKFEKSQQQKTSKLIDINSLSLLKNPIQKHKRKIKLKRFNRKIYTGSDDEIYDKEENESEKSENENKKKKKKKK